MAKQYQFIIMFDEETNRWSVDYDSEEHAFPNGTIYDTDTKTWEFGYAGDGNFVGREQEVAEAISNMLDSHNEMLLKTGENK
jgi:hypothetical protein